jgi:uncharacterized protein YjbI with pentapeptide repeats
MALPVTIPNTFANATSSIPLSQLDANFSALSNAINGINSGAETLANLKSSNVTITGGTISNVTLDNVTVTTESFDNVTLSNVIITSGTITGVTAANIAGANISSGNVTVTVASLANGNAASPSLRFTDDTDTGVYLASANTIAFTEGGTGYNIGYRNIPDGGPKNTSYTLAASDVGKYIQITSGGSITIPDGTFTNGDAVSLFNNTTGNVTVTCSITTAYIAGTDTDKANVTLGTRGVATILFANANVCVITGNVS